MANRVAIADGIDLLAGNRRANTPTLRAAAVATFEVNRPQWRATQTARDQGTAAISSTTTSGRSSPPKAFTTNR